MTAIKQKRFPLGRIMATPGALAALGMDEIAKALARHAHGDWGTVCEEDRQSNDEAIETGARLLSAYTGRQGAKFWIITEADRSATTVLLPEEY